MPTIKAHLRGIALCVVVIAATSTTIVSAVPVFTNSDLSTAISTCLGVDATGASCPLRRGRGLSHIDES